MNKHHYVAIMAGGIGSRFWPMSRTAHPKQFLDILGIGKTLIQQTFERYSKLVPKENIYIVTSREYVNTVKQQLPSLPEVNILSEPSRKNTAPCIAYIAFKLLQKDPEALMMAAPADNLILDTEAFLQTATKAFKFVDSINALVTIGIKPTSPRSEEHTSELQSPCNLVCRLLLEKKKTIRSTQRSGIGQATFRVPTGAQMRYLTWKTRGRRMIPTLPPSTSTSTQAGR